MEGKENAPMERRTDRITITNTMIGLFLVGLSVRTFVISLPTVADGLNTDMLGVSWALIAYQVAAIGLGIVLGQLGDVYSRYKIYGLGLIVATLSALLCGLSQNIGELMLFRFFQGVGGAIIHSSGRALAMEAMPEGSEGKAQGLMAMAHHFGFFIGPPIGGFIIDMGSWRGIFFFLVPFGVVAILLTYLSKHKPAPKAAERRRTVDYGGAALFMILTLAMTLFLDQKTAALSGPGPKTILALVMVGLTWAFWAHEVKTGSPMVDPYFFKVRFFAYSALALLAVCITQGLAMFLMPFYLQGVLGLSASFMGILFLVPSILTLVISPASGHMNDRIGPRTPLLVGILCLMAAFLVGANLKTTSHWVVPTILLGLLGIGSAFFNVPVQAAMIVSLPKERWGSVAGIINTIFGLGHLLGISFSALLLTVAYQHYSGSPGATPQPSDLIPFTLSVNVTHWGGMTMLVLSLWAVLKSGKVETKRSTEAGKGSLKNMKAT